MPIVYLDSTAPDGQIRIVNTDTHDSRLVTNDSETVQAAAEELSKPAEAQ